jgi:hypothetical protein
MGVSERLAWDEAVICGGRKRQQSLCSALTWPGRFNFSTSRSVTASLCPSPEQMPALHRRLPMQHLRMRFFKAKLEGSDPAGCDVDSQDLDHGQRDVQTRKT